MANTIKTYEIRRVQTEFEWAHIPRARIGTALWGSEYQPETFFQCAYTAQGDCFIRMRCAEANPTALYVAPDSPVWEDSCMECFLSFGSGGYLNLEANSNGALLCAYGSARAGRQPVAAMASPRPEVCASRRDEQGWEVILRVPAGTIASLWDGVRLTGGITAKGNFYKCGDKTPQIHYLSWSPIDLPSPDFHAPQFFGQLLFK